MNGPGIAAALLVAAAAGSVAMVAREWAEPVPAATPEQICLAVADLQDALDLSSLGDQAVLRARAASVADMLAAPSLQDWPAGSMSVARAIISVLDDPGGTAADLLVAIEPVAQLCRG